MPLRSERHLSYTLLNNATRRMNHKKGTPLSIAKVTVMRYHLEQCRIRSMAALGLALTTSVIAVLSMLVSAL